VAWDIEGVNDCAVVRMNTNKVNMQNDGFFADLHGASNRLESELDPMTGRCWPA
jgi:enoyl-CoA hydratase